MSKGAKEWCPASVAPIRTTMSTAIRTGAFMRRLSFEIRAARLSADHTRVEYAARVGRPVVHPPAPPVREPLLHASEISLDQVPGCLGLGRARRRLRAPPRRARR